MSHRTRQSGAVNAFHLFPSNNVYGIPQLPKPKLTDYPTWMAPFRTRISNTVIPTDGAIHFFLEDFRFESVWNKPTNSLNAIQKFNTVLSPDFSLYREWPLAIQLWNTYRSRWMGCYWHHHGHTVIPTISWSTADSYEFAFTGIATGSVVAISACGVNHLHDPLQRALFMAGYLQMIQAIQPTAVLCYGAPPQACARYADVWVYPTQWTNIRAMRKVGANKLGQTHRHNPFHLTHHISPYQLPPDTSKDASHGW